MNFIELLYVILIYYVSGGQKLEPEAQKIVEDAHTKSSVLLTMCPYVGEAIEAMEHGKPVDLIAVSTALHDLIPQYMATTSAKASFAEVLKTFASWFKNQNDGAHKTLAKLASRCDEAYIRSMITDDAPNQKNVRKETKDLLTKLGFKGKEVLSPEEEAEVKVNEPEAYKKYRSLRAQHGMAWKAVLANYVKSSGKKMVPCEDALAVLDKLDVQHTIPPGFTGDIDAEGNWYTHDGELLSGVPRMPTFTSITMKSKTDGDVSWVCKANKPDGTFAYVYTKVHAQQSWDHKYAVANVLIQNIDKYRAKWISNIKSPFPYDNVNSVASVIVELLYLSSDRAGSVSGGNEGGAGFGMTSILCKHVTLRPDGGFLISYKGKDAVQFKFSLTPGNAKDKIICEVVAHMVQGKSPRDKVWSVDMPNGKRKPIGYSVVSSFFKSLTGGCNIHKLRTVAGTGLFNEEAAKIYDRLKGKSITPDAAVDLVKGIAVKVGKKLGHIKTDAKGNISTQPMTSLKNYIDFASQVQFFQFFGLAIPKYLEAFMKTDNKIESKKIKADAVQAPTTAPAPTGTSPVNTGPVKRDGDELIDDEGKVVDQTGGPVTKRLALKFLDGTAQDNEMTF